MNEKTRVFLMYGLENGAALKLEPGCTVTLTLTLDAATAYAFTYTYEEWRIAIATAFLLGLSVERYGRMQVDEQKLRQWRNEQFARLVLGLPALGLSPSPV
jgi:hypothetical protein